MSVREKFLEVMGYDGPPWVIGLMESYAREVADEQSRADSRGAAAEALRWKAIVETKDDRIKFLESGHPEFHQFKKGIADLQSKLEERDKEIANVRKTMDQLLTKNRQLEDTVKYGISEGTPQEHNKARIEALEKEIAELRVVAGEMAKSLSPFYALADQCLHNSNLKKDQDVYSYNRATITMQNLRDVELVLTRYAELTKPKEQ